MIYIYIICIYIYTYIYIYFFFQGVNKTPNFGISPEIILSGCFLDDKMVNPLYIIGRFECN